MKKITRLLVIAAMSVILATILCTSFACTPITNNVMKHETEIAGFNLPYSAGQATNEFYDYNSELFYLNETRLNGADPGALYVSEEDVNDSYGKLMHSWQYKDANGAWQWQNGKTQEQFEETYGTLDSWHEQYTDWYYMIYTGELGGYSAYNMFRSHDLNDWKPCGRANNNGAVYFGSDSWSSVSNCWAPEFIRDPDSGMYFIFFSAQSKNGTAKNTYGPNAATTGGQWDGLTISCAMSPNPQGPYTPVTAQEYLEVQAKKNADGTVFRGETLVDLADLDMDGQPDGQAYPIYNYDDKVIGYYNDGTYYNLNGYGITTADPVLSIGYYYIRMATDQRKIQEMYDKYSIEKLGLGINYKYCVFPAIDVNPVIGADGTKMLYFSQHVSSMIEGNHVWCVKMKDWMTPEWDTLTHISTASYNIIYQDGSLEGIWEYQIETDDQYNIIYDANGEPKWILDDLGKKVSNKTKWAEGSINEGTEVLEHNGKWYFTYSPFGYGSRSYAPYVAVSDNATGPFKKLGTAYSPIIGIGNEPNDYMSGTGHHVFIKAGDELWILYHCFWNPVNNENNEGNFLGRCIGVDRAYWKYTPELGYDMLYGNGPTYNLQPKPETYTGYTNVAKYATITGNGDYGEVSSLTDGLFTSQPFSRQWEYGSSKGDLQVKLTWDKPVTVRALLVYNSGWYDSAFKNVNAIKFKLAEKPAWYQSTEFNGYCYIKDLPTFANDYNDGDAVVRKGANALAEFDEITITEMTITIKANEENPNKYTTTNMTTYDNDYYSIRLAELYVMGNVAEAQA